MTRGLWSRAVVALGALTILSGCYSYRAVETAPVGAAVRVDLPIDRPVNAPGGPESVMIEGLLVESGDTVIMVVESRREYGAYREVVQVDTLSVAADRIATMEIKEFSRGRSLALGLTVASAVTLGAAVAFGLGGGRSGDPGDGTPPLPDASLVGATGVVPGLGWEFRPLSLIRALVGH